MQKPLNTKQILLGLSIGLIVTILLTGTILLFSLSSQTPPPVSLGEQPKAPLGLTLSSPVDGMVITEGEVLIEGVTSPGASVVFYTEEEQNSVDVDDNGQFEGIIKLNNPGLNTLIVTAFANTGEEKTLTMDLVYDDQVLGEKTSKTSPGQEKKEENSQTRALVGNVEQVSPNSLIIKEKLGQSQQTIVDKNTKITGRDKKTLKLESLKINDQAAIIFDEETATKPGQIKKALKIFVREATGSAEIVQTKRQAVQGIIKEIVGELVTLTHQIQRDRLYNITVTTQTIIKMKEVANATLANLQVGQRIVVVGDRDASGNLVAKLIHIIPGQATGIYKRYPVGSPVATASASPVASPSATASPSISPSISPSPSIEASSSPVAM